MTNVNHYLWWDVQCNKCINSVHALEILFKLELVVWYCRNSYLEKGRAEGNEMIVMCKILQNITICFASAKYYLFIIKKRTVPKRRLPYISQQLKKFRQFCYQSSRCAQWRKVLAGKLLQFRTEILAKLLKEMVYCLALIQLCSNGNNSTQFSEAMQIGR